MSLAENFRRSRLPEFTTKEIKYIQGTSDFLGLNHYSSFSAELSENPDTTNIFYSKDIGVNLEQPDTWPVTPTFWLKMVPWGLRKLLNWIKDEFDNPVVYITESGMGDLDGTLNDEQRVNYFQVSTTFYYIIQIIVDYIIKENFKYISNYTQYHFIGIYKLKQLLHCVKNVTNLRWHRNIYS